MRERPQSVDKVVELLVVQLAAGELLLASFACATSSRGSKLYTAFMVRGLLMLSVETSEVSMLPGR